MKLDYEQSARATRTSIWAVSCGVIGLCCFATAVTFFVMAFAPGLGRSHPLAILRRSWGYWNTSEDDFLIAEAVLVVTGVLALTSGNPRFWLRTFTGEHAAEVWGWLALVLGPVALLSGIGIVVSGRTPGGSVAADPFILTVFASAGGATVFCITARTLCRWARRSTASSGVHASPRSTGPTTRRQVDPEPRLQR